MSGTVLKQQTRTLWCALTDEELLDRGERMAKAHATVVSEDDRQTTAKKAMKERLTNLEQQLADLARIVEEKREERAVTCHHQPDYVTGMVHVVRMDTGELIETRQMTDEERQRGLFVEVRDAR